MSFWRNLFSWFKGKPTENCAGCAHLFLLTFSAAEQISCDCDGSPFQVLVCLGPRVPGLCFLCFSTAPCASPNPLNQQGPGASFWARDDHGMYLRTLAGKTKTKKKASTEILALLVVFLSEGAWISPLVPPVELHWSLGQSAKLAPYVPDCGKTGFWVALCREGTSLNSVLRLWHGSKGACCNQVGVHVSQ